MNYNHNSLIILDLEIIQVSLVGVYESEETPVPVQLTTNLNGNRLSVTKAGVDAWGGQELYFYALPPEHIMLTMVLLQVIPVSD